MQWAWTKVETGKECNVVVAGGYCPISNMNGETTTVETIRQNDRNGDEEEENGDCY